MATVKLKYLQGMSMATMCPAMSVNCEIPVITTVVPNSCHGYVKTGVAMVTGDDEILPPVVDTDRSYSTCLDIILHIRADINPRGGHTHRITLISPPTEGSSPGNAPGNHSNQTGVVFTQHNP